MGKRKTPFQRVVFKISRLFIFSLSCWSSIFEARILNTLYVLTLNRPGGGGGIRPQAGSSLCCAETVSIRKLKLSDFYYILIDLNSEYKPVPWDIHCCHGNAIVEGCSVKFWLKSVENCIFLLKLLSNLSSGLLFVISISKLPTMPNFKQIGSKTKKLGFSTFLAERSLKYNMS